MKKYICPNVDIQQTMYLYLMAGSPNLYNEEGDGEASNQGLYDAMDDANPSKDNSLWDDAN